ncbi:MAG: hypothetical protein EXQ47_07715 [Bryobacterales bacterium]|nr:hypothetical protein [Bryobacterales bacterium]
MPDRTTIVMPELLKAKAVARARQRGISFGELVRQAVEKEVAAPARGKSKKKTGDPFWDNLVTYDDDGPVDLAARHDDYLYGEES